MRFADRSGGIVFSSLNDALGELSVEPNADTDSDDLKKRDKKRRDAIQYSADGMSRENERDKKRDQRKNKRNLGSVIVAT